MSWPRTVSLRLKSRTVSEPTKRQKTQACTRSSSSGPRVRTTWAGSDRLSLANVCTSSRHGDDASDQSRAYATRSKSSHCMRSLGSCSPHRWSGEGSFASSVSFQASCLVDSFQASAAACICRSRREVPDRTERSEVATESVDGIVADAAVYTTLQTVETARLHGTSMRSSYAKVQALSLLPPASAAAYPQRLNGAERL